MSLAEVREILNAGAARRREAGKDVWLLDTGPWWRFFNDYRGLNNTKAALLDAAWHLPGGLFFVPEEVSEDLAPFLQRDGDGWRMDTSKRPKDFYATEPVRGFGNWQMYAAAKPLSVPAPDTFRVAPDKVLEFMAEHGVALLIDAFHDDTDWCIALRDGNNSP